MTEFSRRHFIAAGTAAGAILSAPSALAHDTGGSGQWTARADMPFPVQEIYPAPFWKSGADAQSLKPQPFNIIVNAGGLTPNEPYNVTDKTVWFDPSANQWAYGAPLPAPRHHLMLVTNNRSLYGIGGFARDAAGGWQMRADCWRLNSLGGVWAPMRPMPHPQAEAVCQTLGGYIHVVGGRAPSGSRNRDWSDHIDTDEHWLYDPTTDRWNALAPLPTPRNSAAGAVVNGILYVVGGRTVDGGNSAAMEVYDPVSNRWEKARPLPKAQGGLAAAALHGKIYAFGGEYFRPGAGGVFADAWEYDPRRDRWRAVASMPHPRHGLGAVTVGNAIYVIGGAARPGGEATSAAVDSFSMLA